jgi:hypothetical protein
MIKARTKEGADLHMQAAGGQKPQAPHPALRPTPALLPPWRLPLEDGHRLVERVRRRVRLPKGRRGLRRRLQGAALPSRPRLRSVTSRLHVSCDAREDFLVVLQEAPAVGPRQHRRPVPLHRDPVEVDCFFDEPETALLVGPKMVLPSTSALRYLNAAVAEASPHTASASAVRSFYVTASISNDWRFQVGAHVPIASLLAAFAACT